MNSYGTIFVTPGKPARESIEMRLEAILPNVEIDADAVAVLTVGVLFQQQCVIKDGNVIIELTPMQTTVVGSMTARHGFTLLLSHRGKTLNLGTGFIAAMPPSHEQQSSPAQEMATR